ncbi:MAG TPA: polymer-forming cytoskeletal protein [Ktedonobacteraceae bacterium]|nr:polymer-forming cytoskeletal protein [Ktedonobacteraceae bacterium]
MQKVSRKQRFMLTLPGLMLFAAFFIGVGAEALLGGLVGTRAAAAAAGNQELPECTNSTRKLAFGSAVVINSGETQCGNITSLGGDVVIHGEVRGDVASFGGDVIIDGQVDGNVNLYGGNLTLQNGTNVNGDIHLCGGRWIEDKNSQLHGNVVDCTTGVGELVVSDVGASFRFWSTLTWMALSLFITYLLPEHVMLVRTTVKNKTRRSLMLGILSILLAPALLVVLFALIIPIPLAILTLVGLVAAWALGIAAIGWQLGDYIMRKAALQPHTRLVQVAVGSAILALAGTLPYIGWAITLGTGLLGLGAVFLSRFGTRLYSQPRQPLPL